jgi:hypothetical protein
MKEFKIEIPNGFEIDIDNSTFEKIVFKEIKKELPKTWEDLELFDGYYKDGNCRINFTSSNTTQKKNKDIFATEEQAKASIALAQLSQLLKAYRNGWVPDWNKNEEKYVIYIQREEISKSNYASMPHFLSFQDRETRDLFLENFKDLIEQAKPLM